MTEKSSTRRRPRPTTGCGQINESSNQRTIDKRQSNYADSGNGVGGGRQQQRRRGRGGRPRASVWLVVVSMVMFCTTPTPPTSFVIQNDDNRASSSAGDGVAVRAGVVAAVRIRSARRKPPTTQQQQRQQRKGGPRISKKPAWTPDEPIIETYDFGNPSSSSSSESLSSSSLSDMFYRTIYQAYKIFSTDIHPLRGILDGITSGFSLLWKFYYQGFDGLDFAVEGYLKDGILGCFKGTVAGTFHFGVMTISGFAAGLYQMVRGMDRTFQAVRATHSGKVWNDDTKEWYFYSLDEEVQDIDSDYDSAGTSNVKQTVRRLRKRVKDQSFYNLLHVPVDASPSEIKKAYYRQALEVHPDKSNESEASDHFRTLNTAYKTLVSEETRDLYDAHGACYVTHMPNKDAARVDPYTFFAIVFETGVVEPYVGDLAIATIVDNILHLTDRAQPLHSSTGKPTPAPIQQIRRQVEIAAHLRDRIEPYTSGRLSLEEFRATCRAEARSLAMALEGNFKAQLLLLRAMSMGLLSSTTEYLVPSWAKPLFGLAHGAFDTTEELASLRDLEIAIKRAVKETVVEKNQGSDNKTKKDHQHTSTTSGCDDDDDDRSAEVDALLEKLSVPKTLRLVWKYNANDITRTLKEASRRVLDDSGNDHELRQARAQALNALGREFKMAAERSTTNHNVTDEDYPDEETIQRTVQKALLDSVITQVTYFE